MLIDGIRCIPRAASEPLEDGTPVTLTVDGEAFSVQWHRSQIHRVPQHGCALCVPTPCVCGFTGPLCPGYFEHRRDWVGAETSWREAA